MKKMFSLALALIMALALCVPALAATPESNNSITIENPDDGIGFDGGILTDMKIQKNTSIRIKSLDSW